jgi:hypothetical protein
MPKTTSLLSDLMRVANVLPKEANYLTQAQLPGANQKLQDIVGLPNDARSTFAQTNPQVGNHLLANPFAPFEGDEIFITGLQPGAKFQAHDGSQWFIEEYEWEGKVGISNAWYPDKVRGYVSVQDIRRSIHSWMEPITQIVPPIPVGVDYGVVLTKPVK